MIKLGEKGYTIVELLISIGILGILTPLLALALFQILTFTERGRAGFEAQADTRNASAWMSQDIVMAQETAQVVIDPFASSTLLLIEDPICGTSAVAFSWTDLFEDRDADHQVTYCLEDSGDPLDGTSPLRKCLPISPCLVRNFSVIDSKGIPISAGSKVIAWNIASVKFEATVLPPEREISVTIISAPVVFREGRPPQANRFGVEDVKTFKVLIRPTV